MVADPRHHVPAAAAEFHRGTRRRQSADCCAAAAGRQAGDLASRVDASHLHRQRSRPGEAEQHDGDQTRNGQSTLDRAEAGITGQTLVVSARLMMLVSAPTIESPVTTL